MLMSKIVYPVLQLVAGSGHMHEHPQLVHTTNRYIRRIDCWPITVLCRKLDSTCILSTAYIYVYTFCLHVLETN